MLTFERVIRNHMMFFIFSYYSVNLERHMYTYVTILHVLWNKTIWATVSNNFILGSLRMKLPCRSIDDYDVHACIYYFLTQFVFFLNCDIHVKCVIKNQCYIYYNYCTYSCPKLHLYHNFHCTSSEIFCILYFYITGTCSFLVTIFYM